MYLICETLRTVFEHLEKWLIPCLAGYFDFKCALIMKGYESELLCQSHGHLGILGIILY